MFQRKQSCRELKSKAMVIFFLLIISISMSSLVAGNTTSWARFNQDARNSGSSNVDAESFNGKELATWVSDPLPPGLPAKIPDISTPIAIERGDESGITQREIFFCTSSGYHLKLLMDYQGQWTPKWNPDPTTNADRLITSSPVYYEDNPNLPQDYDKYMIVADANLLVHPFQKNQIMILYPDSVGPTIDTYNLQDNNMRYRSPLVWYDDLNNGYLFITDYITTPVVGTLFLKLGLTYQGYGGIQDQYNGNNPLFPGLRANKASMMLWEDEENEEDYLVIPLYDSNGLYLGVIDPNDNTGTRIWTITISDTLQLPVSACMDSVGGIYLQTDVGEVYYLNWIPEIDDDPLTSLEKWNLDLPNHDVVIGHGRMCLDNEDSLYMMGKSSRLNAWFLYRVYKCFTTEESSDILFRVDFQQLYSIDTNSDIVSNYANGNNLCIITSSDDRLLEYDSTLTHCPHEIVVDNGKHANNPCSGIALFPNYGIIFADESQSLWLDEMDN